MKVGSRKKNYWMWIGKRNKTLGKGTKRYNKHSPMLAFGVLMKHPWSLGLGGNHYLGFNLLLLEDGMTCYNCWKSSTRQVPLSPISLGSTASAGWYTQTQMSRACQCWLVILSASLQRRLVDSGETFTRYFSVIFNTPHSKAALSQAIPRKSTT